VCAALSIDGSVCCACVCEQAEEQQGSSKRGSQKKGGKAAKGGGPEVEASGLKSKKRGKEVRRFGLLVLWCIRC
jgi:hypothetical protein